MTLALGGFVLHEPDVALTDLALALLGVWSARRLRREAGPTGRTIGVRLMLGLAIAALAGAVFHGLTSADDAPWLRRLAWTPVPVAMALTAAVMLDWVLRLVQPAWSAAERRRLTGPYLALLLVVTTVLDLRFVRIVQGYGPVLLVLLLLAARRRAQPGWGGVAAGLALSVAAAGLQVARVAVHPVWFNHNAVYHVVQAAALVVLHRGLRTLPD